MWFNITNSQLFLFTEHWVRDVGVWIGFFTSHLIVVSSLSFFHSRANNCLRCFLCWLRMSLLDVSTQKLSKTAIKSVCAVAKYYIYLLRCFTHIIFWLVDFDGHCSADIIAWCTFLNKVAKLATAGIVRD